MAAKLIVMGIAVFLLAAIGTAEPAKETPSGNLWKKLNSIIIDQVEFEDSEPINILKFLRQRSKDLDPEKKGVNFVFKDLEQHKTLVTLKLSNLPLSEVIKYVCLSGDLIYKVEDFAVVIMPMKFMFPVRRSLT